MERSIKTLANCITKLKNVNKLRVEKAKNLIRFIHTVFNEDQIRWLQSKSDKRRVYSWSKETIKKALRIKFSCTKHCYEQLIQENIPLPSLRTLRRSLEGINFSSGVLDDIFEAMEIKVKQFTDERQRDCMLGLDEVSLTPSEQFDLSTNSLIGSSTIPNSHGMISSCYNFL